MSITFGIPYTDARFTVSNDTAALILYDLLSYRHNEKSPWEGGLCPSDVLCRLALQEVWSDRLDKRAMRYATRLEKISAIAEQLEEEVIYG